MKLDLSKFADALNTLRSQYPEMVRRKEEIREQLRKERQCTDVTKTGARCEAWAVYGDPNGKCYRHGGAETAKQPKSERYPACRCEAYAFPHRQRSGLCAYPDEPVRRHSTPQGQRRYYKRRRKAKYRKYLEEFRALGRQATGTGK